MCVPLVLLFMLSGCQGTSPVNQNAKNGNGSIAVNLTSDKNKISIPPTAEPSAPADEPFAPADELSVSVNEPFAPADEPFAIPTGDTLPAHNTFVPVDSGDLIEIKEKMFIAQTNDIYFNAEDYLGKTIKYEGIFQSYTWEENGVTYYSVIRYGPGCCGVDANAGFEVIWDKEYPLPDDWVEAVGVLDEYDEDGYKYLRLALNSLTVLDTRGEEYVSQ
jgi:hypothetical protein